MPEALELLSAELGEPVTFRVAAERQFLDRLTGAGIPAGTAELLITREWAILAGENDYTTGTFQQITGRPPRPVAEFLHQYRVVAPYRHATPAGRPITLVAPSCSQLATVGISHDLGLVRPAAGRWSPAY
jgi:hypothetical protein